MQYSGIQWNVKQDMTTFKKSANRRSSKHL
jgi:hypothetical protein